MISQVGGTDSVSIHGGRELIGTLRVPGDKSISHRALLLACLAEGTSEISGLSLGQDVAHTAAAIKALGATVEVLSQQSSAASAMAVRVEGGRSRLVEPAHAIECGNSGTSMRLLAGLVASLDGCFILQGDASLSLRPMARVLVPLSKMGAKVDGRKGGRLAPIVIRGGALNGFEHHLEVASAQVKSAILLAGLGAEGTTVVHEPALSRAHTEEMLFSAGVEVDIRSEGKGQAVSVRKADVRPFVSDVPGDPSQAAFWLVAACCTPGSDIHIENVYLGPGRGGFVDVLKRMGADIEVISKGDCLVDLRARYGPLNATEVTEDEVPSLVDEIPVLAVAAAAAQGKSYFRGVGELRVKESDRVRTTVALLRAFGIEAKDQQSGITVEGGVLSPATIDCEGDHRIAMAAATAAAIMPLHKDGTRIDGWSAVSTSYPGFESDLKRLQFQK